MKTKLLALLMIILTVPAFAQGSERIYGLHLFFEEKEFVDVLTLTTNLHGELEGHMFVPDDFEGPIKNIKITGDEISFSLFVPKNSSRPKNLIFNYKGKFFDNGQKQLVGYVTLDGDSSFIASFVAFQRNQ